MPRHVPRHHVPAHAAAVTPADPAAVPAASLHAAATSQGPAAARAQEGAAAPFADRVVERLLRDRIIVLGSQVDDPVANVLCGQLLLLAADDPARDVQLFINSPGGSVTAGMAIYDTMQFVEPDVSTVVMGLAASMSQFLLAAGTPGKRYALPHARVLMHQPSGGIGGTASDIAIQAESLRQTKATFQQLLAGHTGRSVEEIERDSDRDRWFTAEQARDYGFVDHVVASSRQLPR